MRAGLLLACLLASCVHPSEGHDYTAVLLPASGAQLYKDPQGQTQLSIGVDLRTNRSRQLEAASRQSGRYGQMVNGFLIFAARSEGQAWTPKFFSKTMIWSPHREVGIAALESRNPSGTDFSLGTISANPNNDTLSVLRGHPCAALNLEIFVDHNGDAILSRVIIGNQAPSGAPCLAD